MQSCLVLRLVFYFYFTLRRLEVVAGDISRTTLTIIQLVNLCFVIVAALKGKFFFAIFGIFVCSGNYCCITSC